MKNNPLRQSSPRLVPPSPQLMVQLRCKFEELQEQKRLPAHFTFNDFFHFWAASRRAGAQKGLDNGHSHHAPAAGSAFKIARPPAALAGPVKTVVLLADFPDKAYNALFSPGYFRKLLFGEPGSFPTGSMRAYFREVSGYNAATHQGIDVVGDVYGWFTMPHPLSYYTDNNSGLGEYPRNIQKLAEDAVLAARNAGVDFSGSDVLGEGQVTALFVVHAGRGAEETGSRDDIWSAKWDIPGAISLGPNLVAATFLTVPEDCKVGVCAHEWGHLAGRWDDFYDTGDNPYATSNGLGDYCLMASGAWGNMGVTPVYPNGMLRMFHQWVDVKWVTEPENNIQVNAIAEGGNVVVVHNAAKMHSKQYILVEYRRRKGQDRYLPDEGLAVYVIDETIPDVNDENRLAIELIQADGKRDLAKMYDAGNRGDSRDLYPYKNKRILSKSSKPPLQFPGNQETGVKLTVRKPQGTKDFLYLDVVFE